MEKETTKSKRGAKHKGLNKKAAIPIYEASILEIQIHGYDNLRDVANKAVRQFIQQNS